MPFWLLLLLFVATTVVGALLAPHPHGPQPSALGDFSVPTAEEGRAIPVVFGTVMIKGGNTVWWGDLSSKPIKVSGGILSFGKTQITGYKYYLGCQFMLCHGPVDALVDIQADVKSIPRTLATILNGDGSENCIQVTATGDNLFGGTGPGGGGGISGTINFYRGLDTQQPDDYLGAKQGRVVLDQSGIGYTYSGVGNGTITAESAGTSSLDETITITAVGIDGNPLHSTFGKMRFSVTGSRSGGQHNSTLNLEGSNACWADAAFSCPIINMTIQTGSTQYSNGDTFTIVTEHAKVAAAYRRLCYAVFIHLYQGTSNYLKPMAFVVRRCPDPLSQGSGIANINGDANPALAIYDLLTNIDYGLGIPGARIDAGNFMAAASTLAAEGLGVSMQFDTQASADQLIGEILRHCDGLLYTDPATGLWTIVLARGGYDPTLLPVLTVDDVLGTPDFARGSWSETSNLVSIKFLSRSNNFNTRVVRAYDAANIAVTGEIRPQTIDFNGLSQEAAAGLTAIRVLKTLTYPLAKMKIVANRTAWNFRPGGLFRFTWVPLGVINQVFRITRIGYGELTDGKISIDAVEDIFGINSVAFVAPPSSGWVNPVGTPLANLYEQLQELPRHIEIVEGLPATSTGWFAMCMAARNPATAVKQYEVWRDDGSGYFDTQIFGNPNPIGFLSSAYPLATLANDPVGFKVDSSGIDLNLLTSVTAADLLEGVNLCLIDDEIMSWKTITANSDGTYSITGVLRGLMDTVPVTHAPGAKVWFFSSGATLADISPFGGPTITAKMLPTNSLGTLPLGSAIARSVTTQARASLPYPVGNVRMQGAPYGTRYATITGDLVLTFSVRNRDRQAGVLPLGLQDAGDDAPPVSASFVIEIRNAGVLGTGGGGSLPVANFTYTAAARYAAGNPGLTTLKISGGTNTGLMGAFVSCLWAQEVDVTFTGFGFEFGLWFGGITA
jgi:hypothetical protein